MIQKFVDAYTAKKDALARTLARKHPESYLELVRCVIGMLEDTDDYEAPCPERVHQIDDGEYQGTLVFVIAARGYQPSRYWYVKVSYGSCSGCDTLQGINDYSSEAPSESQVEQYMTLALHIIQGLKEMGNDTV